MNKVLKTTEEKIAEKNEQIEKYQAKIAFYNDKIKKIEKEKEQIVNTEIQGVLRELNLPLNEVIATLKNLKAGNNL